MPLHSLRLQTCRSEAGLQQQQAALYGGGWTALKLFDVLPCSRGTVRDASHYLFRPRHNPPNVK